ncbi:hypothetical protein HY635_01285 [Candidatus Uhrbacteria bacterium]|nr:hypothetical protein [Candidatus Uhrbacteria bacterium]
MSALRLSRLQRAILRSCYPLRGRVERRRFHDLGKNEATHAKDVVDVVTKALERMIDRGLLVGHGVRTKEKWFIKEVRLTPEGRRVARVVVGTQQTLPLHELKNGELKNGGHTKRNDR